MRRLLYIGGAESYIPSLAANSIQVMKMAAAFARADCQVTLLVPRGARHVDAGRNPFEFYGVPETFAIDRLAAPGGSGRAGITAFALGAVRQARRGWDLVFGRHDAAAVALARAGVTNVFEAHRFRQAGRVDRALLPVLRSPLVESLILISSALVEPYTAAGVDPAKLLVAPDAADGPASPDGDAAARRALKQLAGLNGSGRPIAVYAGALSTLKGTDMILDVARSTPEVDFVIIGGPDADTVTSYRQRSKTIDNLTFTGTIDPGSVGEMLAGADVLVMPHTRDSERRYMSPLKIFEYLAAGRPLVATDLIATRDVLVDGEHAVLVPPDEPEALAGAIRRVVADERLATRLGAAARQLSERCTWEARARQILAHVDARRRPPRRRVLHILNSFQPSIGGAERQAAALARMQAREGDEVAVLTRRRPGESSLDGVGAVGVHRLGWPLLRGPGFVLGALWWLRRRSYSVLHAHQARAGALIAALAGKENQCTVVKIAGLDVPDGSDPISRARRWALRRLDVVAAVGPELARAAEACGITSVHIVPNGVDTERFQPSADRAGTRLGLGLPATSAIVVYVGRLEWVKGIDLLLAAWPAVARADDAARLLIVGTGSTAAELERRPPAGVEFRGAVDDPRPYYQAADLLVIPSRSEGLSNVLLEGMASGVCVLASNIEGNTQVLSNRDNGYLVPSNEPAALSTGIIELLADPELRSRLARAARQTVLERYRLERVEKLWAELYGGTRRG